MRAHIRRWIAAALLVAAVLIPLALLEQGSSSTVSLSNGTVASGRSDRPVYILHGRVADFGGAPLLAVANEDGLYARHGIPWAVARFGSFLLAPLLAICAIAFGLMNRWVLILGLFVAAWLLFANLIEYKMHFVLFHTPPHHSEIAYDFNMAKLVRIEGGGKIFIYDFDHSRLVEMPLLDTRWDERNGDMGAVWGYYPAWGAPKLVAVGIGLVTPVLLLIAALAFCIRGISAYLRKQSV